MNSTARGPQLIDTASVGLPGQVSPVSATPNSGCTQTVFNEVRAFRQRATQNGYRVIRVRTLSKMPLPRDWQHGDPDLLLAVQPDAANTGLLLAGLRCIDVDVDDQVLVGRIVKAAQAHLPRGALIRRRAGSSS